jgi:zinc protease
LCVLALLASLTPAPLAAAEGQPAAGDEGKIFPYESHVEKLDNGLTAILVPMKSGGLVAYWSIVRTGSRDEYEPGHTGFAHFFEHMMFRGTERYPAAVYNAKTTEIGADANAFTTDDYTAYHLGIAAEDLETVMDLESDRFKNLDYPQPEFETEAGAVYGEYRKNRTNPFFALSEAIQDKAYTDHTYSHTTMGYEKDIAAMPTMFDYSRSFFHRYYRPENTVLVIAGDLDVAKTTELIKKYYGDWEPGYTAPTIPTEPEQKGERRVEVKYDGRSLPILWVAYHANAFDPSNRSMAAANLLCDLAFGETSDLYKKLVLEEQVVEFLNAGAPINRDPGLLEIITRIKDPSKVDYVLAEIDKTIAAYQQSPPDAQRLTDLKSRTKYQFLMNLETPEDVAGGLSRFIAITGGIEAIDQMYRTLDGVTAEDVQSAAEEYLAKDRRTVGILQGTN